MKKLLGIVVLGFFLSSNTYAIPHWLGPAFELCKVNQNIKAYHHTRDGEKDSWKIEEGKIILKKGDYLSAHKTKGKRKFYVGSSSAFPAKNDVYDKIVMIGDDKGLKISDILDCQKYKPKLKKIKYNTYNIFTQEDLFNGLKDNKKIKAQGNLEIPPYKKCKEIKKFPLMFLIHHSGGDIMMEYKFILHEMCVATFEPFIFRARGHHSNFYDTTKEIA